MPYQLCASSAKTSCFIPGKEGKEHEINELLAHLNANQKICLVLRAQEELSYEEIARALNVNINTVRTRLKRAREILVARYRDKEVGYDLS